MEREIERDFISWIFVLHAETTEGDKIEQEMAEIGMRRLIIAQYEMRSILIDDAQTEFQERIWKHSKRLFVLSKRKSADKFYVPWNSSNKWQAVGNFVAPKWPSIFQRGE